MANFKTNIERKCIDDSVKLNYLIEHCSNETQSLIEDCVLLGARGYRKAKELLDEEYGQESDIAADYLEFLKAGEKIEDTDVDALSKLAQDMAKCSVTLKKSTTLLNWMHKRRLTL